MSLFSQRGISNVKKFKKNTPESSDFASEDSVFNLLANGNQCTNSKKPLNAKDLQSFANLIAQQDDIDSDIDETEIQKPTNHVPIDWSLKTKLRILSNVPIPGSRLKSSEEASGITG